MWGSRRFDSSSSSSCFTERSSSGSRGPSSWSGSAWPPALVPGPSVSGIALLQRKPTHSTSEEIHTQIHSFLLMNILLFMPAFIYLQTELGSQPRLQSQTNLGFFFFFFFLNLGFLIPALLPTLCLFLLL